MSKKNSLFMFILMCLFMFVGIDRVEADGMTCLYRKYSGAEDASVSGYFILTADSNGDFSVYYNFESLSYTDPGWKKLENSGLGLDWQFESDAKDSDGNVTSCPRYMYKYVSGDTLHFSDFPPSAVLGFKSYYVRLYNYQPNYFLDLNSGTETFEWIGKHEIRSGYKLNSSILEGYKTCMYASCSSNSTCEQIIQLDFSDNDYKLYNNFVKSDEEVSSHITAEDINASFNGSCPLELFVANGTHLANHPRWIISLNNRGTAIDNIDGWESFNYYSPYGEQQQLVNQNNIIKIEKCEDLFSSEMLKFVSGVKNLFFIAIPLILIGFGIADFAGAVFKSSEDDMKKVANRFVKRVIIAIVIFLIPSVLQLLLTIASGIWENIDPTLCGIFD